MRYLQPLLILAIFFAPLLSFAEDTRVISGLMFRLDKYESIDEGAVQVVIGGNSKIVPEDMADEYIIKLAFQNPDWDAEFEVSDLFNFIRESLILDESNRAANALSAVLDRDDVEIKKLLKFLREFLQNHGALTVVRNSLRVLSMENRAPEPLITAVVFLGMYDTEWVQSHLLRYAYVHRKAIIQEIQGRFQDAIAEQDFSAAQRLVLINRALFGESDDHYRQLHMIYTKLRLARDAMSDGEVEQLFPLVSLSQSSDFMRKFLTPILRTAFHSEAENEITNGNGSRAIAILARIPKSDQTPLTIELTRTALRMLKTNTESVIFDPQVESMLRDLADADPLILERYENYLIRQINFFLKTRRVNQVDPFLIRLREYRPDPNRENDEVRLQQAMMLKDMGHTEAARRKIEEMYTGVGLSNFIYLLHSGFYFDLNWLLLVILGPVAVLLGHRILLRRARIEDEDEDYDDDIEEDEYISPEERGEEIYHADGFDDELAEDGTLTRKAKEGFSYLQRKTGLSPKMHEYTNLMRRLRLEPDADLKEIKATYRTAVKECHPDLAEGHDQAAAEEFRIINETYEAIIRLRKELGMPDA